MIIILENKDEEKSEDSEDDFSDKETNPHNKSEVYDFWEKEENVNVKENPNKEGNRILEGLDDKKGSDVGSDDEQKKVNEGDKVEQKKKETDERFEI